MGRYKLLRPSSTDPSPTREGLGWGALPKTLGRLSSDVEQDKDSDESIFDHGAHLQSCLR